MGFRRMHMICLIGLLQLFALVYSNPPIDTPSRCANARKPENGTVKCCIDIGNAFDAVEAQSGSRSSSGGSSKGSDVYTCTYSCNKGYHLNGARVLECPISSVTDNPTCEPVVCNTLPTIEHGSLKCNNSFLYGSQCKYTCAPGFNISGGSNSLTCGSDGFWSGPIPKCEPVLCPPLPDPKHGSLSCPNSRSFGADCRYICDDRYTLDGSPIVTCSETGKWVGETPTCELGECSPLPLLVHGSLSCTSGWDSQSRCYYTCHNGFSLTGGNFILTCGSNGFWRGDIPTCEQDTSSGTTFPPSISAETNATTGRQYITTTSSNLPTDSEITTDTSPGTTSPPSISTETKTTTDYTTENDKITISVTSGNATETFSTYEMLDADDGPANLAGRAPAGSGNNGNGGSGLNAAAIISIVAVAIILVVVGIGLFVAYHNSRISQEAYGQL